MAHKVGATSQPYRCGFPIRPRIPPVPPQDACADANINNAITPDTIYAVFNYEFDSFTSWLKVTLKNTIVFPKIQYRVEIEFPEKVEFVCTVPNGDPYQCVGRFIYYVPDISGTYRMTIYSMDVDDCALATIYVDIPEPPNIFPLGPTDAPNACSAGQTYHPGWPYNNGCCTDGCWCQQNGQWGCWQTCAPYCQ